MLDFDAICRGRTSSVSLRFPSEVDFERYLSCLELLLEVQSVIFNIFLMILRLRSKIFNFLIFSYDFKIQVKIFIFFIFSYGFKIQAENLQFFNIFL